jgi:transposase
MVAAVSQEFGLEGYLLFEQSVNSEKFILILAEIERNGPNYKLLGDNASWHRSKITMKALQDKQKFMVFNGPYSPTLNPIELVFRIVKCHYKHRKLSLNQQT